jgi:Tol biopolymer transport system component
LVFGDGRLQQVTTDGQTRVPAWSADGRLFIHRRAANNDLVLINTDGSGAEQITRDGSSQGAAFATPDRKWLVFHHLVDRSGTGYDLWIADLSRQTPPRPLIQTSDLEAGARLHASGAWIAYATTRAGRAEIWIASFPDVTRKMFVSGDGSREPVWSRDGRELFFRNGTKMYAVTFEAASRAIGQPKLLFDAPFFQAGGPGNTQYDVGVDGRFLMLRSPEHELPHWILMQGWTSKIKAALAGK